MKHRVKGCSKVTGYHRVKGKIRKVKVHTKKSCLVKKVVKGRRK